MKIKQKLVAFAILLGISGATLSLVSVQTSADCGGVATSIISCDQKAGGTKAEDTGAWGIVTFVIKILTGGIGVLAIAGIIYGAILYVTSEGSPEGVKKAIEVFRNVVIGIIAYALMFAVLNFIIPGGIFG
jgi:hypothetical protein